MSCDSAPAQIVERRVSRSLFHITGLPVENEVVLHERADGWFFMRIRRSDPCGWWGPFGSKEEALCLVIKICRPTPEEDHHGDKEMRRGRM